MSPKISTCRDVPSETSPTRNQRTEEDENTNEEHSAEFEFCLSCKDHDTISYHSMLSPDELFCNGEIVPLVSHPELLVWQHRFSEKNKSMKSSYINRHNIMVAKTSQPSKFGAVNDMAASSVSISKDWKNFLNLKMDTNGVSRQDGFWRPPIREAKTAKSFMAFAQSVLKLTKPEAWAPWCCSTAVVPATLSVSPAGATANPTDAFGRLVMKFKVVDINAIPVGDAQTVVTYTSPLRVDVPDTRSFPRADRDMVCNGNGVCPEKAAVRNANKISDSSNFKERKNFLVAELKHNGKIRRQERPLRRYEIRKNCEKAYTYERNAQVTQVLHMNGCMGKSLLSHKVRFSERRFSDCSNRTTSKYNIDR